MRIPFDVNDPGLRDAFLRLQLLERLDTLQEDAAPRWGRMTAQQMIEHLVWGFEVSTGRAHVECRTPEAKRERMKVFLYDRQPMRREFRNPALVAGLPPLRYAGAAEARAALRVEVHRFLDQSRTEPAALHTHPVFGPIGMEEWERAHYKHGHHHLLQFDLIAGEP